MPNSTLVPVIKVAQQKLLEIIKEKQIKRIYVDKNKQVTRGILDKKKTNVNILSKGILDISLVHYISIFIVKAINEFSFVA